MPRRTSLRRRRRIFAILLLLAPPILIGTDLARAFVVEDRCLDSGGVYDDRQERCRRDVVHLPRVSYWERRPAQLVLGGFSMLLGGWMLGAMRHSARNLKNLQLFNIYSGDHMSDGSRVFVEEVSLAWTPTSSVHGCIHVASSGTNTRLPSRFEERC